jgi:hypothetical protein
MALVLMFLALTDIITPFQALVIFLVMVFLRGDYTSAPKKYQIVSGRGTVFYTERFTIDRHSGIVEFLSEGERVYLAGSYSIKEVK